MRWFWNRRRRERELDEEIEAHFRLALEDRMDAGQSRREFGNVSLVKEVTREMGGWTSLESFLKDIRYAARGLRRAPGFAITAILTLALGIGANPAIFTLVHAVMLKSLPVADP